MKRAASSLVDDISNDDDHPRQGDLMGFIEEFDALPRGVLKCQSLF